MGFLALYAQLVTSTTCIVRNSLKISMPFFIEWNYIEILYKSIINFPYYLHFQLYLDIITLTARWNDSNIYIGIYYMYII